MPGLLRGRVHTIAPDGTGIQVLVPSAFGDGVRPAFGCLPDATPGDLVRVDRDERNALTVVAWQPAP